MFMGDMNGNVGSESVAGVVGKWGVPARVDESGSALLDVCAGRGLMIVAQDDSQVFWRVKRG